jgi:long-chain acyl-CoA synthetase
MVAGAILKQDFSTISDLIRAYGTERPTAIALIKDAEQLDYAQLNGLMDRVATSLQREGLRQGDVVAICARTSQEYCGVFLGALRGGIAVAPLSPSSTPQSIASMAADCDAKMFFIDSAVGDALAGFELAHGLKRVMLDTSDVGEPFGAWLAPAGTAPSPVTVNPNETFNIIYSSGTTGEPKGIVHSHRMRWVLMLRAGMANSYGASSVTIISTPLYANTTLASLLPTLAHGGCAVLMEKFDPIGFLRLAERHRATHSMLVPVQYQRIMAVPDFERFDLTSFVMKNSTSAPFSADIKAEVLRRWPGGLTEVYGLTEGGGACFLAAHLHPDKLHTVGTPSPGHDIRLIDEQGKEVAPGEMGEIVGHSPMMMTGYYRRPEKTAEVEWHDPSGKRFIRTGDIGRFDKDGFLVLMDRKKDMIISGGFNVYPSDLETVLARYEAISEAAVVGVVSEKWGETPVAFVALKSGRVAAAAEICKWVNGQVGKTQRLAAVEIVDALPRSAIGKVLKRELREQYVRQGGDAQV